MIHTHIHSIISTYMASHKYLLIEICFQIHQIVLGQFHFEFICKCCKYIWRPEAICNLICFHRKYAFISLKSYKSKYLAKYSAWAIYQSTLSPSFFYLFTLRGKASSLQHSSFLNAIPCRKQHCRNKKYCDHTWFSSCALFHFHSWKLQRRRRRRR